MAKHETKKSEAPKVEASEESKTLTEAVAENAAHPNVGTSGGVATEAPKAEANGGTGSESKTVVIQQSDLDAFLRRLDTLEADNRRLLEAADKARMAAITERERQEHKGLPIVRLTRMGGKFGPLVIAWKMTRNESFINGRIAVEHQEIEVFYDDGKSERMPLINFYRQQNRETQAVIVARTKTIGDDGESLRVRMEDGKEIDIDLKFVN